MGIKKKFIFLSIMCFLAFLSCGEEKRVSLQLGSTCDKVGNLLEKSSFSKCTNCFIQVSSLVNGNVKKVSTSRSNSKKLSIKSLAIGESDHLSFMVKFCSYGALKAQDAENLCKLNDPSIVQAVGQSQALKKGDVDKSIKVPITLYPVNKNLPLSAQGTSGNWYRKSPQGQGVFSQNLHDISYLGSGVAIAVGDQGTILERNSNGLWSISQPISVASLRGVAGLPSGFAIAVGGSGTILEKAAGAGWKVIKGVASQNLNDVYILGTSQVSAVVVGDNGSILERDAQGKWLSKPMAGVGKIHSLSRLSNGIVLAVGDQGFIVERATDGNWYKKSGITDKNLFAVAGLTDGTAVAVGQDGIIFERSVTGKWESRKKVTLNQLNSVAGSGPGKAIAVGEGGVIIQRNSDGVWRALKSGTVSAIKGVSTTDQGMTIAVGSNGALLESYTSGSCSVSTLQSSLSYGGVASVDGSGLIYFGGLDQNGGIYTRVQYANLPTGRVSSLSTTLSVPRYNFKTIQYKDEVFLVGGQTSNNGPTTNVVDKFKNGKITAIKGPPYLARTNHVVVANKSKTLFFIVGGSNPQASGPQKHFSEIVIFDPSRGSFASPAGFGLQNGREFHDAEVILDQSNGKEYLVVFGGEQATGNANGSLKLSHLEVFVLGTWQRIDSSGINLAARAGHALLKSDQNSLVILGGIGPQGYNTSLNDGLKIINGKVTLFTPQLLTNAGSVGASFSRVEKVALNDGSYFIAGGTSTKDSPNKKAFYFGQNKFFAIQIKTGNSSLSYDFFNQCEGRIGHSMIVLENGIVAISGGERPLLPGVSSCPGQGTFFFRDIRLVYPSVPVK